MQKLILPFKKQMFLAGYKTQKYLSYWGYNHFGIDISSIQGGAGMDAKIYGSGNGEVIISGYDNAVGNVVVVKYPLVYNHRTGEIRDVIARYMHLEKVSVKKGDRVDTSTVLGIEGKTGTQDYHLHLEFDSDTKYPLYTPQVKGSNILKNGGVAVDSTIDPSYLLHRANDRIVVTPTYNPEWLNQQDKQIPFFLDNEANDDDVDVEAMLSTIHALEEEVDDLKSEIKTYKQKIEAVKNIVR